MGKVQKKGEAGAAVNYITRSAAVKKLQLSLANFRRLCILKGIYPREPSNKKKAGKGSTAPKTFYYRKDIQYLLHEPILQTLRDQKIHKRKLKTAVKKQEWGTVKTLEQNLPEYRLDHVIRERYPSFVDALRDLDDALSMIFLFATLPSEERIRSAQVKECQRLSSEFMAYIVESRSLRKVFLSIKGVYYQAELCGQDITWIVPYQFSQMLPVDVDFKVMGTFLELYISLLNFVNYKLYADHGLSYPPKVDLEKLEQDCGITSFLLESTASTTSVESVVKTVKGKKKNKVSKEEEEKMQQRLKNFDETLENIQDDEESEQEDTQQEKSMAMDFEQHENSKDSDQEDENMEENNVTSLSQIKSATQYLSSFTHLFEGCVFWLSRETPRWSLEFVIRAFGGQVGWEDDSVANIRPSKDSDLKMGVSPFTLDDSRITHHVVDRPVPQGQKPAWFRFDRRDYVQPQWIFDCVNAKRLLKSSGYHPGEALPPHLSPFVKYEEGDYKPEQAVILEGGDEEVVTTPAIVDQPMKVIDSDDEEEAGVVKASEELEKKSEKERAMFMMSKKDRRLYQQIEFGKKKKEVSVDALKKKKEKLQKN